MNVAQSVLLSLILDYYFNIKILETNIFSDQPLFFLTKDLGCLDFLGLKIIIAPKLINALQITWTFGVGMCRNGFLSVSVNP